MQNFGMSMLWFWISYILVTCARIIHTIINIYVLGMKPMDENGMGEGYEKTKPWHPLYNIISFSIFGFAYMNGLAEPTITEAMITGAIWAGICIVFDVFGWVLILLSLSVAVFNFKRCLKQLIVLKYMLIQIRV